MSEISSNKIYIMCYKELWWGVSFNCKFMHFKIHSKYQELTVPQAKVKILFVNQMLNGALRR